MTDLTRGELGLIRRALRYYIHGEQLAIQNAHVTAPRGTSHAKHLAHVADVKRQADAHIAAAEALLTKLLPQSHGTLDITKESGNG